MNRFILKEIIKSRFELISDEAINGKDCLQMIKEKSLQECCSTYKIIFMDFEMPIMNGLEVWQFSHLIIISFRHVRQLGESKNNKN